MLIASSLAAAGVLMSGGMNASANTKKKVTVHTGDTVSQIAVDYSTSVKKIKKVNHMKDAGSIKIGEKLILPPHAHKAANADKVTAQAQPSAPAAQATNASANAGSNAGLSSIAQAESGNSYSARNGQYIGKYQLSSSYLHGDYSAANQEKVAHQYAVSRYGSVANAAAFRKTHGYW